MEVARAPGNVGAPPSSVRAARPEPRHRQTPALDSGRPRRRRALTAHRRQDRGGRRGSTLAQPRTPREFEAATFGRTPTRKRCLYEA